MSKKNSFSLLICQNFLPHRFFSIFFIPTISAVVINCHYSSNREHDGTQSYTCKVTGSLSITSPGVSITGATGNHLPSMTNDNVTVFILSDYEKTQIVNYMPRDLTKIFPNLVGICISDTPMLEIHQDDLKEFSNLKSIQLTGLNIKSLEENLFKFNPELDDLRLSHNKIKNVFPTIFDNLTKLNLLDFSKNDCYPKDDLLSVPRPLVLQLIEKIKKKCPWTDDSSKSAT